MLDRTCCTFAYRHHSITISSPACLPAASASASAQRLTYASAFSFCGHNNRPRAIRVLSSMYLFLSLLLFRIGYR